MNTQGISIPKFEDRELLCVDCGCDFIFEKGEQEFYWMKGLTDRDTGEPTEPKRCPDCRAFRRQKFARERVLQGRYGNGG